MLVSQTQAVEQPKPLIQAPLVVVVQKPVKRVVQPVVKQEPVTVIGEAEAVAIGEPVAIIIGEPVTIDKGYSPIRVEPYRKVCSYNFKLKKEVCTFYNKPFEFRPVIN